MTGAAIIPGVSCAKRLPRTRRSPIRKTSLHSGKTGLGNGCFTPVLPSVSPEYTAKTGTSPTTKTLKRTCAMGSCVCACARARGTPSVLRFAVSPYLYLFVFHEEKKGIGQNAPQNTGTKPAQTVSPAFWLHLKPLKSNRKGGF